jgi:hypothetical protein
MNEANNQSAGFVFSLVLQLGLAVYVYWCVRHGFISLRSERIYRKKNPRKFKILLGSYLIFATALGAFTLYHLLKP